MASRKTPVVRTVVESLDRELTELAKRAPGIDDSTLAASARVLAQELDKDRNSATSKSMCQKALSETIARLYELAPVEDQEDGLDDIATQRKKRLAKLRTA